MATQTMIQQVMLRYAHEVIAGWIQASSKLKLIAEDPRHSGSQKFYAMDVKDDQFVHFTTQKRAEEILKSGKLLYHPPYEKSGIVDVNAISTVYGGYVPTSQILHTEKIQDEGLVVGVVFKTNTRPKYGRPEEVYWGNDVQLIDPKIVSKDTAISMLKKAPEKIGEMDIVAYDDSYIKKIKNYYKKKEVA